MVPFGIYVPGRPGQLIEMPAHIIYVGATLLDLAGIDPPIPLDGWTLAPSMRGNQLPSRSLFLESPRNNTCAVIDYPWKLIHSLQYGQFELHDIKEDRYERANHFSPDHPRAIELQRKLFSWYERGDEASCPSNLEQDA